MIHIIGVVGTCCVLGAYWALSTQRLLATGRAYQAINLAGSILLATYSILLVAWAQVGLNAIWGVIATVALVRNWRASRPKTPAESSH